MTPKTLLSPTLLLVALIAVLGLIYTGQSDGQIMFDDQLELNLVQGYSSFSDTFSVDCFGLFRPIKNLIFYAWTTFLPDQIQAWRVTAIITFLGLIPVTYCFFGLFFKKQPWLQLMGTALWASAPAATTVICWISSSNIIISGYGFFSYFLLYEKAQKYQSLGKINAAYGWLFLSLLSLALACFSYEAAMAAPFLLLLKDYLHRPERLKPGRTWIFFALSFLTLGLYFVLRGNHGGANTIDFALCIPTDSSLWVSLSSGWFYIIHAVRWIWPFGQQGISIIFNPEAHKALVIISAIFVVSLGILILKIHKQKPKLVFGLGWYALALFPMANVIPLKNGPICDYYLFFPSIGLIIAMAEFYRTLQKTQSRNILAGISMVWLAAFLLTTWTWVPNWKSREALAEKTLQWQPDNFILLAFLAEKEILTRNADAAELYLERALQVAPAERKYRYNIEYLQALWLGISGRYNDAATALDSIIESHRQSDTLVPVHYQAQIAYIYDVYLDQSQKAEEYLGSALEAPWDDSFSWSAALRLADIHIKNNRPAKALEVYQFLLSRNPGDQDVREKHRILKEAHEKNIISGSASQHETSK